MGHENGKEQVNTRRLMDHRGRVQVPKEDRMALGLDELEQGEKALLEMEITVIKKKKGEPTDG